jgi:hypothetical protein
MDKKMNQRCRIITTSFIFYPTHSKWNYVLIFIVMFHSVYGRFLNVIHFCGIKGRDSFNTKQLPTQAMQKCDL